MYKRYLEIKNKISELESELDLIKGDIFVKAPFEGKQSCTFFDNGFKINVQQKESVSVDQSKACKFPSLFKTKYEYSKTIVNKLSPLEIKTLEECITTKPAKPSFTVEREE